MKAAVWTGAEKMEVAELPMPVMQDDEVLLKIVATGVCGTDLAIYKGLFDKTRAVPPMALGYEFCGVITERGRNVKGFNAGDFVAADALLSCGKCFACLNGFPHVCRDLKLIGVDVNGGFAEYVAVKASKLHRLPDGIAPEIGGIVEPCAVAIHDIRISGFKPGDNVLVIGGGPIGILMAEILRNCGVNRILVSEINEARLALLKSHGIDAVSPGSVDMADCIRKKFKGIGPDISFEVSGTNSGYQTAVDNTRIRGTVVQVGIAKGESSIDMRRVNFAELSIVGTRVYEPVDFDCAVNMLSSGKVNIHGIVSSHFLDECPAIFAELVGGKTSLIKPVIKVS